MTNSGGHYYLKGSRPNSVKGFQIWQLELLEENPIRVSAFMGEFRGKKETHPQCFWNCPWLTHLKFARVDVCELFFEPIRCQSINSEDYYFRCEKCRKYFDGVLERQNLEGVEND